MCAPACVCLCVIQDLYQSEEQECSHEISYPQGNLIFTDLPPSTGYVEVYSTVFIIMNIATAINNNKKTTA